MASAERSETIRTVAIVIIACVAVVFIFAVGRQFFQPIAIAFVLNALFRPVVRAMERVKVPTWIGATIVTLVLIGLIVVAVYFISGPVKTWIDTAPQNVEAAQQKLDRLRKPVQRVSEVADKIEKATQGTTTQPTTQGSGGNAPPPAPPPAPATQGPSMLVRVFGTTTALVGGLAEVILLLYLLLGMGDRFLQKIVKLMEGREEKSEARRTVRDVESSVARYMYVTLLINLGQGAVVAIVMKLLGMPSWIMWGLLTVVLEFIPYLGAAVMIILLSITAFTQFDSIGHILAVPGAYLLITNIQNNIVSPIAYGNRLKLNPVAVLIGVILWWFLWGIPGAFAAVPIMAAAKIVCDRVDALKPIGEFLGD